MKNCKQKNRGFTLIELLLYIGIISILLGGVMGVFYLSLQFRVKTTAMTEVEAQGTVIMNYLIQSIRNADTITSPSTNTTGTSLALTHYPPMSNSSVYNLSNGKLTVQEAGGAIQNLHSSKVQVSNLFVQNLTRTNSPGTIRVSFTVSATNVSGKNEYAFSKNFYGTATLR